MKEKHETRNPTFKSEGFGGAWPEARSKPGTTQEITFPGKKTFLPQSNSLQEICLPGKRTKSANEIQKALSGTGFSISEDSGSPLATSTEAETLLGSPSSYWSAHFLPDKFIFRYTQSQKQSPQIRRLEMLSACLDLLFLTDSYSLSSPELYSCLRDSLSQASKFQSTSKNLSTSRLISAESELKKAHSQSKKISSLLEKEASVRMELERSLSQMKSRLEKLEGPSLPELENEIFDWLHMHEGKINAVSFARMHGISESRVEEALDSLLKGGYIARKK